MNTLEEKVKLERGRFFAVSEEAWKLVCAYGDLHSAVAYLIMAAGTQKDNVTTAWSAQSVKSRMRTRWDAADDAIKRLVKRGQLEMVRGGKRPRYKLWTPAGKHKLIWLPNALIEAVDGYMPIDGIISARDLRPLNLLVTLYGASPEIGGIDPMALRQRFSREKVAETDDRIIWRFSPAEVVICDHLAATYTVGENDEKLSGDELVKAECELHAGVRALLEFGLFSFVPHLSDGDDSDMRILHPSAMDAGEPEERRAALVRHNEALGLLPDDLKASVMAAGGILVAAPKSMAQVSMVGIARPRHQARTALSLRANGRVDDNRPSQSNEDQSADDQGSRAEMPQA